MNACAASMLQSTRQGAQSSERVEDNESSTPTGADSRCCRTWATGKWPLMGVRTAVLPVFKR
jgi:hypothetical protein